jgi:rhamnosyltransferase
MKYVTVFIPTFNGEKYIEESLRSILGQELPNDYKLEVLLTDSGSSDQTLRIIDRYKDRITINQIPNSEFSHSQTRMSAALRAKGEFIVFLTQDATPINKHWLKNLIEPFYMSDKIGIVFGKQVPRPNAVATIKREVATAFMSLTSSPESILVHRHLSLIDSKPIAPLNTFFSDVNSAVRKDILINEVPFRKVSYAEDQSLAEDMLTRGYLKAYSTLAAVWHSNEFTPKEYMKRKFDEYIGLKESTQFNLQIGLRSVLLGWIKPTLLDFRFILKDIEYSKKSKLLWFIKSPLYNIYGKLGYYLACKHFNNPEKRSRISLESINRSSAQGYTNQEKHRNNL